MWVHYICLLIVIVIASGLIALTFNIAVQSNIDYLKDLTNEPKSTYCNILKEAQQKCLKTIERLTPWRDAIFYTFIIMDVLYLILLLFGK